MRKLIFHSILLVTIALFTGSAAAVERHVPSEYSTIQAAIDDCNSGDVVIIEPNTYTGSGNKNLDFGGKAITVRSNNPKDPCVVAATIIDCQNSGRGFYFHSGEGADSIVSGLTIINGRKIGASGHYAQSAHGGGIYCGSGTGPHISNCIISNNFVRGGNGADEYYDCGGSECVLVPATDGADAYGGGIYCHPSGGATITNCTFKNNQARGGDSGDFIMSGPCGGESFGGAICGYSNLTVKNCLIIENYSVGGAGIMPGMSFGCGIYSVTSNISNCTIVDNIDGPYDISSGIYGSSSTTISDCIIWGHYYDAYDSNISYSCTSDSSSGIGVIHDDPCFVTGSLGDYYLSQTAAGQTSDSPCVDTGSDTAVNLGLDANTTRTDHIGDKGIVDMGYHYPLEVRSADIDENWYVDFIDFAILAGDWDSCGEPCDSNMLPGDIFPDWCVDFNDLAVLVDCWLDCYVASARNPTPGGNAAGVDPNIILNWTPGAGAVSHDVYFGTDYNDVNNATINSNEYMGNQDTNSWDPNSYDSNGLAWETTYHWRIDSVGHGCRSKGNVWSFTTFDINFGLVGWWEFDEGEGDTAYDSAGNNDGTLVNGLNWTTGQIGGALDFNGISGYVEIADDDSLTPSNEITIAFWLYNRGGMNAGIYKYAACPSEPASPGNSRAYIVDISADTLLVKLSVFSSTNTYDDIFSNNAVDPNTWHHIAATFDQGDAKIYIDGVPDGSKTMSVSSIMNDAQPLIFGGRWTYCGTDYFLQYLNGILDDVRIYDRALDAEEIWQLYQMGQE